MKKKYTDEEANARFEQLADQLDVETAAVEYTDDLALIAQAAEAIHADELRLREAVRRSRTRGRSWNRIAVSLGVSRQAARARFADTIEA